MAEEWKMLVCTITQESSSITRYSNLLQRFLWQVIKSIFKIKWNKFSKGIEMKWLHRIHFARKEMKRATSFGATMEGVRMCGYCPTNAPTLQHPIPLSQPKSSEPRFRNIKGCCWNSQQLIIFVVPKDPPGQLAMERLFGRAGIDQLNQNRKLQNSWLKFIMSLRCKFAIKEKQPWSCRNCSTWSCFF